MDTSSTVFKALDALTILAGQDTGLLTVDIAIALDQPRSNVLRVLHTLQRYGLVAQTGRRWTATPAFREWSAPPSRHVMLRDRYAPVLDAISSETGELTVLGLHEGNGILHIDYRESVGGCRPFTHHGIRHGLRNNALGKLALSRRPDLAARVSDSVLQNEIQEIQRTGVAWEMKNETHNAVIMAIPGFFNEPTEPMLSIAWPTKRFNPTAAEQARRIARRAMERFRQKSDRTRKLHFS